VKVLKGQDDLAQNQFGLALWESSLDVEVEEKLPSRTEVEDQMEMLFLQRLVAYGLLFERLLLTV
jgi:hypothetical protein